MARTSTAKTTTKTTTATAEVKEKEVTVEKEPTAKAIPTEIDVNQMIVVKNGYQGKLVYESSRTGEKFIWDQFGDEQEMELRELKNAKNSRKAFFINNWFMFDPDDMWVIEYLGLKQYYKNCISVEDFDTIFTMSPDEIYETISELSEGQKRSIEYRARVLLDEENIDSNKVIAALEKALDTKLVER